MKTSSNPTNRPLLNIRIPSLSAVIVSITHIAAIIEAKIFGPFVSETYIAGRLGLTGAPSMGSVFNPY